MPRKVPIWALALHVAYILDAAASRPPFVPPPGWTRIYNGVKWVFSRDGDGATIHHNPNVVGQWVSRHSEFGPEEQSIDHWWPSAAVLQKADDWLTSHPEDLLWATAAADLTYDCDIAIHNDIPIWLRPNPYPAETIRASIIRRCADIATHRSKGDQWGPHYQAAHAAEVRRSSFNVYQSRTGGLANSSTTC